MERTIRVTGKGRLSVKPDQIRLIMDLSGSRSTYEQVLALSAEKTEAIKCAFEKLGFDRQAIKTTNFNVGTKYESYQDIDNAWKNRFVGYEFRHSLKIEFDVNDGLLGKVLYALAQSTAEPEFRIIYTVKDMEACRNRLLAKAVTDSKEKATTLAEASGVALGDILSIDYSWSEVEFTSSPMDLPIKPMSMSRCKTEECCAMGIEPDDMDITDTVTVIWSIG